MQNTLLNVSGVVIAFITLMLLFSIVVTGLVQVTQSVFRLRGRNLLWGLKRVLQSGLAQESGPQVNFEDAVKVLEKSQTRLHGTLNHWVVSGPQVSWLDPADLEKAIEEDERFDTQKVVTQFRGIADPMSKRFQLWTRLLAILFAALVAWFFQLSTPQLLADLSASPAMVQGLEEQARLLQSGGTPSLDVRPGRIPDFFDSWEDWTGWLITVILLSLGAPFWFNALARMLSLRDQLTGKQGERKREAR